MFGIKFDTIRFEKDLLFCGVKGMFESIWRIELKVATPFLYLYDYRLDINGLNDEFSVYEKEFVTADGQKMTRCKQRTFLLKKEEIAKIT